MNNNEPKRRMSTEEKLIHYQGLREENAKLINMREAAVKESEKLQREVKNLTETNSKLNDALMEQAVKAFEANARSEKLNDSMKEWIKLHDLKAKENIELKAKVHTLEARDIDNQKEIEWQKDQKNILREKLEHLRKNPTSALINCIVWDENGARRYNEYGVESELMFEAPKGTFEDIPWPEPMSTKQALDKIIKATMPKLNYEAILSKNQKQHEIIQNLEKEYQLQKDLNYNLRKKNQELENQPMAILQSTNESNLKYVYAILPYPNHKDIILYRNLDKALEVLKNIGATKGHNVIMYPLEIEE